MFRGTSIVDAPEFPATTLAASCYLGMFRGCKLIERCNFLPAATLKSGCYTSLFNTCPKFKYIKTNFNSFTVSGSSVTGSWLKDVASIGVAKLTTSAATQAQNALSAGTVPTTWAYIDYNSPFENNGNTSLETESNLTSNTSNDKYVVSASNNNEQAWKVMDGDESTYLYTDYRGQGFYEWWQIDFKKPVTVTEFYLKAFVEDYAEDGDDIRAVIIEANNEQNPDDEKSNWIPITEQIPVNCNGGGSFDSSQGTQYTGVVADDKQGAYRYYRIKNFNSYAFLTLYEAKFKYTE